MILLQEEKHQYVGIKTNGNNGGEKWFSTSLLWTPLLLALAVILLAGCGGGGGGSSDAASDTNLTSGVFLDSAVEGLHYETATQSGDTDMDGTFHYMDGETVQFFMGDVLIGEAPAESIMTPVDLVPGATDETNPTVTNISRFLQTMDMDADPSNGIFIPDSVITEMQGRSIDFNMSPQDFETNMDVTMMMDTLGAMEPAYAGRMIVSVEAAQAHMGDTLSGMFGDGGMMNDGHDGGMSGGSTPGGGGMMNGGGM